MMADLNRKVASFDFINRHFHQKEKIHLNLVALVIVGLFYEERSLHDVGLEDMSYRCRNRAN